MYVSYDGICSFGSGRTLYLHTNRQNSHSVLAIGNLTTVTDPISFRMYQKSIIRVVNYGIRINNCTTRVEFVGVIDILANRTCGFNETQVKIGNMESRLF